jgi:hypothetical protein
MTAAVTQPAPRYTGAWALRMSTLLWALLILVFLSGLPVLLAATWLALPALLVVASVLALGLAWAWRRLWRPAASRPWRGVWLRCSIGLWFLLCGLAAAPVYYLSVSTETSPAIVPTVTLSNGPRTVVLQGMQHVGVESFYKSVVYDAEKALAEGYTVIYEGVADGDPASVEWFRRTMSGGKDLGDSYRRLGKVCGLSYQIDYMGPLVADARAHPERHQTMDVTTSDMMREYTRLVQADPAFAAAMRDREKEADAEAAGPPDFVTGLIERQKDGNERQNALAGTLCRGIMTQVMRRSMENDRNPLNPVVLDMRNRHLAAQLLADRRDKLYVTYGAGHLPGVIELLRRDPAWQVKSVKWMRTIAAPQRLEGKLSL